MAETENNSGAVVFTIVILLLIIIFGLFYFTGAFDGELSTNDSENTNIEITLPDMGLENDTETP